MATNDSIERRILPIPADHMIAAEERFKLAMARQ